MKRTLQMIAFLASICIAGISASYAFELNGFADVSFTKSTKGNNRAVDDTKYRNGDFAFGTLDLYLAESLDDIDVLVELIVENGDVLDLERITIGYTFSDAAKLRVGRFHTPLGYWNNAYHHGVQLQPTIDRPSFLKFEDFGGILPTHVVGTTLLGRIRTGAGAVEYGIMIGNGPRITESHDGGLFVLHPNNTSDNNIGKAVAFNASISPEVIDGLKVGISGHIAEIESDGRVDFDNADSDDDLTTGGDVFVGVDQTIFGASFMYSTGNVNLSGEYFSINNSDKASDNEYDSSAYYGLITYAVSEKWVPYVMYENLSVKEDDPYVISLGAVDTEELTVGLRYNINYRSSVKGEYRNIIDEGGADWNEFAVQWALAF